MRIDTAFPGQYLKAADLQGRPVTVTMERVEMETVGDELKPVLYFVGKQKGLVLNKTNSNAVATAYGYETDAWHGQHIQLVEAMVDFQGRSVPAIRVRVQQTARAAVAAPMPVAGTNGAGRHAHSVPQHPAQPPAPPMTDDEVPF